MLLWLLNTKQCLPTTNVPDLVETCAPRSTFSSLTFILLYFTRQVCRIFFSIIFDHLKKYIYILTPTPHLEDSESNGICLECTLCIEKCYRNPILDSYTWPGRNTRKRQGVAATAVDRRLDFFFFFFSFFMLKHFNAQKSCLYLCKFIVTNRFFLILENRDTMVTQCSVWRAHQAFIVL